MDTSDIRAYIRTLGQMAQAMADLCAVLSTQLDTSLPTERVHKVAPSPVRASGGWVTSDGEEFKPPSASAVESDDTDGVEDTDV